MQQHAKLPVEQFAALLTAELFPHKDTFISKQLAGNLVSRDIEIMTVLSQFQNVLEPICSINNLFGQPIAADYEKLLCSPQILVQFQQELSKESPLHHHLNVFTENQVPEDFILYSKHQKTSQKLTQQEMQIAEQVAHIQMAHLIISETNMKPKFSEYKRPDEIEDEKIAEWEEKQAKKTKAGDFKLGKGNKFGALEEE